MAEFQSISIDEIRHRLSRQKVNDFLRDNKDNWFTIGQVAETTGASKTLVARMFTAAIRTGDLASITECTPHFFGTPEVIGKLREEVGLPVK